MQIGNPTTSLKPIQEIASSLDIQADNIIPYGHYIAKIEYNSIDQSKIAKHKLILVTAMSPTKAGIGKTTVSIGLALGMNKIGKKAILALREPSLGPCFGMKGGATGGGKAQVLPKEDINLHFTGDFHAITTAHNMISALLDNYIFRMRNTSKGLKKVIWKRVLDINDRGLRSIITGLGDGNGIPSETGFDITPASEIMAILCLSLDKKDLRRRIEKIILGYTMEDKPFTVGDLGATGAVMALLKHAVNPNLVQTNEHTPAFIHGGPFANIAHGCNSIIATKTALAYGEYVITEAGFGADLGAEKFFNIVCRKTDLKPSLTVLVITTAALKVHGGMAEKNSTQPNKTAIAQGFKNMDKHVYNLHEFGQTVLVVLNRYDYDTDDEIAYIKAYCESKKIPFSINDAFLEGSNGAIDFAYTVTHLIQNQSANSIQWTYEDSDNVKTKIEKVCKKIYGAKNIYYQTAAEKMLTQINLVVDVQQYPICIAKTQYSFSSDPKLFGVPEQFDITVRDIIINNGAEIIVVVVGDIMRMPGLPKEPQALRIDLLDDHIIGLV